MRTQVGIVGAGPAGLMLGQLLDGHGVDTVILELRSREHCEGRQRAGLLEQGTVDLLYEAGVRHRMRNDALFHDGIEVRYAGRGHRIPMRDLTGRQVAVWAQTEVVKDLIEARLEASAPLYFKVSEVQVSNLESAAPIITYQHDGTSVDLRCDVVAGCDGFHGICRPAIPGRHVRVASREYPFGWLGIIAAVAPSTDELIYANSDRGFALHSMRSPQISRLYIQCRPDDDLAEWPDQRVWEELHLRLARDDGWALEEGPVLDKAITPMRSFVAQPMRYGRLFLAGDAAHIVPPTGAKGLNLAIADVKVLAEALVDHFTSGDDRGLEHYSEVALRRVWRAEHFSWWMTSMLHRFPDADAFELALQRAQLEYLCCSDAAGTSLAENYTGLPL